MVVEAIKEKKGWRLVLNQTCFFPEGGGQPADKGWLNDIPVIDVQKDGDLIYHYLTDNPGSGMVKGRIDLEWRRDFMQQHTGQHIISGALWKVGRYKTVSVHMGLDYTTIEIDAPDIPAEDLLETERLANQVILSSMPIDFIHTNHQEVHRFPLRKPPTHKGDIRLVKIGDFDCVGCGGLHFDCTRQVGLVKATGVEKIRGHARITWKIGERAYADYREKDKIISALRPVLGTREDRFVQKASELQEELLVYKRKCSWLENRLADRIAQDLYKNPQSRGETGCRVITESWREEDDQLIKKIIKSLLKGEKVLVCLVNVLTDKLQWSIGCSGDITFPFDELKDDLLAIIDGKGGGRYPLWQGTGKNPQAAGDFLKSFTSIVLELDL